MKRAAQAFTIVFALVFAANCASMPRQADGTDPEQVFASALAALEREDFQTAFDDLVWVYQNAWGEPVGRRALLVLAAAELDPRNPMRRLGVGAELLADYMRAPGTPPANGPVAEALYLLALELGAAEEQIARAEAEAERAEEQAERARAAAAREDAERTVAAQPAARGPLPELPGPPVTARIRELDAARRALAAENADLEALLAECRAELERIEQTLEPADTGQAMP